MIRVEAICIGDELLDGRIRDLNAVALGEFICERGALLTRIEVVPDDHDAIVAALARTTAEIVVVSGGLGPTVDDLTRPAAAEFAGTRLILDEECLERIKQRFEARGYPFTPNNRQQATFPGGAEILRTEVGTAPGFRLEVDGRDFFFYPGVPSEYCWYLERTLEPRLGAGPKGKARTRLFFHGIGESALESHIEKVTDQAREHGVAVAYRADYPVVEVKLSGPADAVGDARDAVLSQIGPWVVGQDDETLSARIGRLLLERGATLTTAESCSGGGVASLVTETPGSSSWFQRAYITYANDAKMDELGVSADLLLEYGAVSPAVAMQMASGARRRARADYALAVSGIAGPGGGTQEKPVGTVHFALATPDGVYHRMIRYRLPDRHTIRAGTAWSALALLLWYLERRLDEHSVNGPYSDADVWSEGGVVPSNQEKH